MKKFASSMALVMTGLGFLAYLLIFSPAPAIGQNMPFGGPDDVAFAKNLWAGMNGYTSWLLKTDYSPGRSPHGEYIRAYFNIVNFNGKHYFVIAKDNFNGSGISLDKVRQSPDTYLTSITVMVKRSAGYDSDNENWYWVKYNKDGSIAQNEKGVALAGRVAKGMDQGCIACHAKSKGDDYFFAND